MPATGQIEVPENEAFAWIERKAKQRGLKVWVYRGGTKKIGGLLRVPMWLSMRDAYGKAQLMQKIEDSWNNRRRKPAFRVFLVPAAKPLRSTKRKD